MTWVFSFLWSIPFLCSHMSHEISHNFLIKAINHLFPDFWDPISVYYSWWAMLHSKEAHPSSRGYQPGSSCCCVVTEIEGHLDSGKSVSSLQLRRPRSMLVIISGSVWASSSHIFREDSDLSQILFAPLLLQMAKCAASSGVPQHGQESSSHLPQCFIHFPTPE